MTAKQALREIVDDFSEEEASRWLSVIQSGKDQPHTAAPENSMIELARMPIAERRRILERTMKLAEVDIDEAEAWESGTGSDVRHIDD